MTKTYQYERLKRTTYTFMQADIKNALIQTYAIDVTGAKVEWNDTDVGMELVVEHEAHDV